MAFPETTFSDNFNRANGALGAGYATLLTAPSIASNQVGGSGSGSIAVHTPTSLADMDAVIKVPVLPGNNGVVAVYARCGGEGSVATFRAYSAYIQVNTTGPDLFKLNRTTGGTEAAVIASDNVNYNLGTGDMIGIRCVGTTIEFWYCPDETGVWSKILTGVDATYSSGFAGFLIFSSTACIDDFGYGEVAGALPDISATITDTVGLPTLSYDVDVRVEASVVYTTVLPTFSAEADLVVFGDVIHAIPQPTFSFEVDVAVAATLNRPISLPSLTLVVDTDGEEEQPIIQDDILSILTILRFLGDAHV